MDTLLYTIIAAHTTTIGYNNMTQAEANKLASQVLHLRMPYNHLAEVKKLAIASGLPTATQARLLVREALQARKLIT